MYFQKLEEARYVRAQIEELSIIKSIMMRFKI